MQLTLSLTTSTLRFRVAALATHFLALYIVIEGARCLKVYVSPDAPLLAWASFALHPLLMLFAFGLFAPLSVVSEHCYRLLGLSHAQADGVHLALASAAVLLGWLGIWDMWDVHGNNAAAQVAKGWDVHFQSSHAWIGLVVMVAYTWQWLGALLLLSPSHLIPHGQAARARPTHALMERYAVYGGIVAILTGILSLNGRADNEKGLKFKVLSMFVLLLGVTLGLLFVEPLPTAASVVISGHHPVSIGIEDGQRQPPVGIPITQLVAQAKPAAKAEAVGQKLLEPSVPRSNSTEQFSA